MNTISNELDFKPVEGKVVVLMGVESDLPGVFSAKGEVIFIGEGVKCEVGDRILLNSSGGQLIDINKVMYTIINDSDIYGILEEDQNDDTK